MWPETGPDFRHMVERISRPPWRPRDHLVMGGAFARAEARGKRTRAGCDCGYDLDGRLAALHGIGGFKDERRLLAAHQLDIDFRQQLRIEQRPMLRAVAVVDPVAPAKRVERIRPHGVLAPGDRQRVDDAPRLDRRQAKAAELRIEEADIEIRVVRNEHGALEKLDELRADVGKGGLVGKVGAADAVHRLRFRVDRAPLRIDEKMVGASGRKAVDELDRTELNDPVGGRVEARRLGVEDYLAHDSAPLSELQRIGSQLQAQRGAAASFSTSSERRRSATALLAASMPLPVSMT
jgi:hypothetical protein